MLLNDVVMGNATKLKTTDQSLKQVGRCIPRKVSWYFIQNLKKTAAAGV
jgi:hypothetical protein